MELPVKYKETMKELLGGAYDDLISSYDKSAASSIRINTSKISAEDFKEIAPFPIEPVPFVSNGYYVDDTDAWSKHPYYYAGLYYIQEASAMLPAYLLPVNNDDTVCDLCAAPGGKSTELSVRAGLLVANDISRSRTIPLVKNLEKNGCGNFLVTCEDPAKLSHIYAGRFDKVLVDAPCSGEGMFRKDPKLIAAYMQKGPEDYCSTQKEIIEAAYELVKPGGMIMYSTCTFSDIEDEQVISSFTDKHKDIKLIDISGRYEGFEGPYAKYAASALSGCIHVFPHRMGGEGHFLALMKKEEAVAGQSVHSTEETVCFSKLSSKTQEFLRCFRGNMLEKLENGQFVINNDGLVTMLPEGAEEFYDKKIHYSRTGTCIGKLGRSGKFLPHTALALSTDKACFSNILSLRADDENVYRYLKGETLSDENLCASKGYVLVCVDKYPLGFAKYDGVRFKNLYEKGWRYV